MCVLIFSYWIFLHFWNFGFFIVELFGILVLSLRHFILLFGVLFVILVMSVPSFDLLYFVFCYAGGLIIVNFLMVTGDVGNTTLLLVVLITSFSFLYISISIDYVFLLLILFILLFM